MDNVTLGIITYNALEITKKAFELHSKYTPKNTKFIILDNDSSDKKVVEFLETQEYLNIKLIPSEENHGFAKGHNIIQSMVDTEFYICMNPDVYVCEGWLEKMMNAWDRHKKDNIGILGCHQIDGKGDECHQGMGFIYRNYENGTTLVEPINLSKIQFPNGKPDDLEVQGVTFSCAMWNKDIMKNFPLSEKYVMGFYEDADLCMRVREAGYTIFCDFLLTLVHYMHGSWGEKPKEMVELGESNLRVWNSYWRNQVIDTKEWLSKRIL